MLIRISSIVLGMLTLFTSSAFTADFVAVRDLFTVTTTEEALWEALPEETATEEAILKAGGVCDFIKTTERRTCLFKVRDGQRLRVFVYDADSSGAYSRTEDICLPTWYSEAAIATADVLGDGRKALLIEHFGNVGTNTDQRILAILAWHSASAGDEGAFRLIFWETVSYHIGFGGDNRQLDVAYDLLPTNSPPEIRLTYHYKTARSDLPFFEVAWQDRLIWNAEQFRFKDPELGQKIAACRFDAGACIQKNIYATRLKRSEINSFAPFCEAGDDAEMLELHNPYAPCWPEE
ncbi:hypothetical protein U14_03652 [Candidatus Moduliflexus flocculans]|uniref:Uncharacterized protein n=1 Tax=Candidatus Moduliflexus flocculans TaxID=1499966 RepID=A0A081BPT5_9BACT|nr:hypothetical protein U14_03652 [Candidatus Moduliflexus flocculans]